MEKQLTEGTTSFLTNSEDKITKDMPVFYNPVMKLNRDLTLGVLLSLDKTGVRIGLPLEASGIRAARILNELVAPGFLAPELISINDLSQEAILYAEQNIALNIGSFDKEKVRFSVADASQFLRASKGFDYIDIDPFGTPNPFLDAAVQRISRDGILAVTATDTSALAGTYPAATARKYWSVPSRTWVMHDVGLRMLIRKVQLVAAQYEKALIPVLSLATDHYYRLFFRCERSISPVKEVLKQHKFLHVCSACLQLSVSSLNAGQCIACNTKVKVAGPMWIGPIQERAFIGRMRKEIARLPDVMRRLDKLLALCEDECKIDQVGFLDLHELSSLHKIAAPTTERMLELLGSNGSRTHINGAGVKIAIPVADVLALAKQTLSAK